MGALALSWRQLAVHKLFFRHRPLLLSCNLVFSVWQQGPPEQRMDFGFLRSCCSASRARVKRPVPAPDMPPGGATWYQPSPPRLVNHRSTFLVVFVIFGASTVVQGSGETCGCLQGLKTLKLVVSRVESTQKKAQENQTNELVLSSEGGGGTTLTKESTRCGLRH